MPGADYETSGELPWTVRAGADPRVAPLCGWLRERAPEIEGVLARHGAIRFRGFAVETPEDFEAIARAIAPDLQSEYLGTSPRDPVSGKVFNASELPGFYPIPQHCEMSFCAHPPRRVFFCALEPPVEGSGETPLCDFRQVWRDLDPGVRERFLERGLRIVRNYSGPAGAEAAQADPLQLKRWDEMFGTTDRTAVEERSRREGFEPVWLEGDGLRLLSTQPVFRDHPVTGERAWHNHLTTFHLSTAVGEYERIVRLRPTERHRALLEMARALEAEAAQKPAEQQAMHCTALDGSEIPREDVEHVRDVVWRHMVIEPWLRGDVVAIDNFAVAHGRLPYEGPRRVVVCWA